MSTRGNIEFSDKWDTFFIDRSHDAFPDNILADIKETVDKCKGRWSGSELGQLVSYFLGSNFDPQCRIQNYEPISGLAGDECYEYYVKWDEENEEYIYGVR